MCVLEARLKMLKLNRMSVPMRPEAAPHVMNRSITLYLSPFSSIAVGALLICSPRQASAADVSAVREPSSQPVQVQQPSVQPQGHQMRRYQAFTRQAELPSMTEIGKTTLQVGGVWQTDTSRLAQLSTREQEALAGLFAVPTAIIAKVIRAGSDQTAPTAAQLAKELRTAVVDYRFLRQEWGRYHPPAEVQQTKTDALAALQAGDLARAWALYDGLSRPGAPVTTPAPPANLRILAVR
jgi:hypothetical protein